MTTRSASSLRLAATMLGCWCVLAACSSDGPAPRARAAASGGEEVVTPPPPPPVLGTASTSERDASPPPPAAAPSDVLYDPDKIPSFELEFEPAAIALLSSTLEADKKTWVHARFKFGSVTFADVGVRRKGGTTYRVLPDKASLKVKFNKWVKGQKLYGLEELTLNNMGSDPTRLSERLAYHVFRAMDLPAQRANTAHLSINGEDYGIYANVETPDENFLARVFGNRVRSLYEVVWGSSWMPGDTGYEIDIGAPGAPAGTMPDIDQLSAAVAASKDETLLADLSPRLHVRQWLRHSATEAVTGHHDGYAYGFWESHNYFMVGDVDGKFSLVPWSTDLSFSDSDGVPDAANPRSDTALVRCMKSACWTEYKNEMKSVLSTYEKLDLVSLATKWHDQIDPLVRSDPKGPGSIRLYEETTAKLFDWLAARPSVIRTQLGL